ncbi:hypothetical protein [Salmonella phage vB_StyS-sam]|uniref:Uncharacterized protein n=1 Tax=Salmonella phage vB_StyS-sam TaxID=2664131 RepID=A0A5K7YN72_9CAUD|nr:hypothetical protein QA026_gp13 [Salmonella phage vB_StyS-sam]BBO65966.1 hypothetical protein [Salmonella phage vB_StyS-sam]
MLRTVRFKPPTSGSRARRMRDCTAWVLGVIVSSKTPLPRYLYTISVAIMRNCGCLTSAARGVCLRIECTVVLLP